MKLDAEIKFAQSGAARLSLAMLVTLIALSGWSSCETPGDQNSDTMEEVSANPWRHVEGYVVERISEFDQIGSERKAELDAIADYVQERHDHGLLARLMFVCTHNARRSQMAQVWSATAIHHYGLDSVMVFSGGSEKTAVNERAIGALRRAGMEVRPERLSENPRYSIKYAEGAEAMTVWSKLLDDAKNPRRSFSALMTCTEASHDCPVVEGAEQRFGLAYVDPKISDGTPEEFETYDARCAQISREMLYAMSQVANGARSVVPTNQEN